MKPEKLIVFLRCPYCHFKKLVLKGGKISCHRCGQDFNVVDGVPIMMRKENLNRQEITQKVWFEKHYSRFSKAVYRLENWRLSMLKRIFAATRGKKIKNYLDIGCGATGYTVIEAAKRGWLAFGMDISLEAMRRARGLAKKMKVEERTAFLVCSAENLPFRKNEFDYISAISLFEHLDNDRKVAEEIGSVLKKKGILYICTPNTYLRMWPFLWPVYFVIDRIIGHKRHYSLSGLNRLLVGDFRPNDFFYNAHLGKLFQLVLEKLSLIDEAAWWKIEDADINKNPWGIQLNAIYEKI